MTLSAVAFPALGTTAVLVTDIGCDQPAALEALHEELASIDLACSRFRPDSELMAVNRNAGCWQDISPGFATAVSTALVAAEQTGGAVDPTVGAAVRLIGYDRDFADLDPDGSPVTVTARSVPGWQLVELDRRGRRLRLPRGVELDLGATAKALAADRSAARAASAAGGGILVSLGGDIAMAGPPPAEGWPIRVAEDHRAGPGTAGETVRMDGGGLATSSTVVRAWTRGGRRLHHIVDPGTGEPANGPWRTVTTAAVSCVDANTAATAALVRGEGAIAWLEGRRLPSRLVSRDGRVTGVAGWPAAA